MLHLLHSCALPPEIRKKKHLMFGYLDFIAIFAAETLSQTQITTHGKAGNHPHRGACNPHLQRRKHPNLPEANPPDKADWRASNFGSNPQRQAEQVRKPLSVLLARKQEEAEQAKTAK